VKPVVPICFYVHSCILQVAGCIAYVWRFSLFLSLKRSDNHKDPVTADRICPGVDLLGS